MKPTILIACLAIFGLSTVLAQDPVKADPAHYKIRLNNAQVRVLEIRVKPGDKTPMHSHPDYLIYAITPSTVRFTTANGKSETAKIKAGEVLFRKAESHSAENIGKTEVHVLNIELKK